MQSQLAFEDSSRILDAIDANITVLDADGCILYTNKHWRNFAAANPLRNGAPPRNTGQGANYLAVCRFATGHSADSSLLLHDGLQAVLQGRRRKFTHEYPCHSPTKQRWFLMTAIALPRSRPRQVLVTHYDITARYLAELRMLAKQNELNAALSQLQAMATKIKEGLTVSAHTSAPAKATWQTEADVLATLSGREREVFADLVRGERNAAIADRLQLSRKSISTYRARIFDKLKVSNLAELISLAARVQIL